MTFRLSARPPSSSRAVPAALLPARLVSPRELQFPLRALRAPARSLVRCRFCQSDCRVELPLLRSLSPPAQPVRVRPPFHRCLLLLAANDLKRLPPAAQPCLSCFVPSSPFQRPRRLAPHSTSPDFRRGTLLGFLSFRVSPESRMKLPFPTPSPLMSFPDVLQLTAGVCTMHSAPTPGSLSAIRPSPSTSGFPSVGARSPLGLSFWNSSPPILPVARLEGRWSPVTCPKLSKSISSSQEETTWGPPP